MSLFEPRPDPSAPVLDYLQRAECREPDAWLRDDYRIAWLTVHFAGRGYSDPWRFAFWWYLGRTPEKLIPFFVSRAARHAAMEAAPARALTTPSQRRSAPAGAPLPQAHTLATAQSKRIEIPGVPRRGPSSVKPRSETKRRAA